MISDEFETYGDNHFWRGQTKTKIFVKNYSFYKNPEYSFKTNIHFLKIQNIYSNEIFICLESRIFIQKKIFIFLKCKIFIQKRYSFVTLGTFVQLLSSVCWRIHCSLRGNADALMPTCQRLLMHCRFQCSSEITFTFVLQFFRRADFFLVCHYFDKDKCIRCYFWISQDLEHCPDETLKELLYPLLQNW